MARAGKTDAKGAGGGRTAAPVNAILGLLTPADVNPPAPRDLGFVLAGLEVPIVGPDGRVDVDLVVFHPVNSHFVLFEARSGANIEERAGRSLRAAKCPRDCAGDRGLRHAA